MVSSHAGGSQTVTGTEVTRSSVDDPAGQRIASVARRVPDSRTRSSGGAEHGPHSTPRLTVVSSVVEDMASPRNRSLVGPLGGGSDGSFARPSDQGTQSNPATP